MQSFNPNPEHLMNAVYSYPFPEVRSILSTLELPPEFMLNTLTANQAQSMLEAYNFTPKLLLPEHVDGTVNLDELHIPIIERIRKRQAAVISGIDKFEYAYPQHGSSNAMFSLLAEWKAHNKLSSIAILPGEYEGYVAYANALKIPVHVYDSFEDAPVDPKQYWFVSNPNAANGNWLDSTKWQKFIDSGRPIVVDAAYVGLTVDGFLEVNSPNIHAVLTSPSKIFGVFRHRYTGITYTREPVQAMYGSKWFKDVPALLDTLKLYESFNPNELPQKYKSLQEFICKNLVQVVGADITPSDVILLGHSEQSVGQTMQPFNRAGVLRLGLTKLFEDAEEFPV